MRLHMVWYGMVNVDLYGAIITKVSNALNTLVSGEKPGFQTVVIIGQFCPTLHSLTPAGHPGARGLTQISDGPILNFNFRKTFLTPTLTCHYSAVYPNPSLSICPWTKDLF